VTEDMADQQIAETLRALGEVEPPAPGVLQAAREALWSAVAGELLSASPADEPGKTRPAVQDLPGHRTEQGP
jgi:hypothetical protein